MTFRHKAKGTGRFARCLCVPLLALLFLAAAPQAYAEGDAKKGAKIFKRCTACHTVKQDGKHKVGPNLWGTYGQPAGKKEGFKYSKGLLDASLTWDDDTLQAWLKAPKKLVKDTKMLFVGLKKSKQRANVIAYLKTLQ